MLFYALICLSMSSDEKISNIIVGMGSYIWSLCCRYPWCSIQGLSIEGCLLRSTRFADRLARGFSYLSPTSASLSPTCSSRSSGDSSIEETCLCLPTNTSLRSHTYDWWRGIETTPLFYTWKEHKNTSY